MKQAHIIVEGKVHGVFFRESTKNKANQLGLNGYVKNLPDGNVEIVAEGNKDNLRELIEFCRGSPGASKVSEVKFVFQDTQNIFNGFVIKY